MGARPPVEARVAGRPESYVTNYTAAPAHADGQQKRFCRPRLLRSAPSSPDQPPCPPLFSRRLPARQNESRVSGATRPLHQRPSSPHRHTGSDKQAAMGRALQQGPRRAIHRQTTLSISCLNGRRWLRSPHRTGVIQEDRAAVCPRDLALTWVECPRR